MTGVSHGEAQHAALASRTRREVLELLAASAEPLGAAEIAERVDLHVTTARFHLDQLEAAHLIRRDVEREGRRGRPRVVYLATPAAHRTSVYRQLIDVLAGALSADPDGGRSRSEHAGEEWADALEPERAAPTADEKARPLVHMLDSLGFEPERANADGDGDGGTVAESDLINLLACPFREAALDNPSVVCSVHRGLIQGTVTRMGHSATDATLHPFVQPELCTVSLHGSLATH